MKNNSNRLLLFDGKSIAAWNVDSDEGWNILSGGDPSQKPDADYFRLIPTIYRGVTLRGMSVANVPFALLTKRGKDFDVSGDWQNKLGFLPNFRQLLNLVEMSLCLTGRAYLFRERNIATTRMLRYLLPTSVTPDLKTKQEFDKLNRPTGVVTLEIEFKRMVENVERTFYPKDIVYFWLPDPLVELGEAINYPCRAAANAAGVLKNVDIFASKFFERGAIKALILSVKGSPPKDERERLESWFRSMVSGVKNAFAAKIFGADTITATTIGEGLKEIDNPTLGKDKREDIAVALGIPMSILFSDAANYATAQQDDKHFYDKTIIPECEFIASIFNDQVFKEFGYRLVFRPDEMDIYQEHENARAQSLSLLVNALSNIEEFEIAAKLLGYEINDEVQAMIDALLADKEKNREQMAEQFEAKPEPEEEEEGPVTLEATPSGRVTQVPATAALDLERWQRKAVNALLAGKPASVIFTSSYIPHDWYTTITERLSEAETEADIKAAFDIANVYSNPVQVDDGMLALAAELKRANDLLEVIK